MSNLAADTRAFRIGFLAALETDDGAFVAGLLVTNRYGRPLEFQCTSPVRPTRAQQLLYGDTLRPYLLGELMGTALLDRIATAPHLLVTDNEHVLDLRNHISIPMARVSPTDTDTYLANSRDGEAPPLGQVRMGCRILTIHHAHEADVSTLHHGASQVPSDSDLHEPLVRVRQALRETLPAQPTGARGASRP